MNTQDPIQDTLQVLYDCLDQMTDSIQRRRWNALADCIQDYYPQLLQFTRDPTQDIVQPLALGLRECIERTRDKDFKMGLCLDFGNFIALTLDPGEYVSLLGHPTGDERCTYCMLDVWTLDGPEPPRGVEDPLDGPEPPRGVENTEPEPIIPQPVAVFHRRCQQFVAHPRCLEKWVTSGAPAVACPRCQR